MVLVLLLAACANPGSPDGGLYDEEPPQVVASTPAYGALQQKGRKISIFFNENVRIESAAEKVVISPTQINQPEISASGRRIKVALLDSLRPNTTYTVDFSDAIVDNNEGNPLGHYAFVFSTGDVIDTMEVSGRVLNAQNLEPIKGILVGLHAVDSLNTQPDTLFRRVPFERVGRTNGSGYFRIRGIKPGTYRAYALNDADGDYAFSQKSEMIAFPMGTFKTSSFPDVRLDSVWLDLAKTRLDSLRPVPFTHFLPDDLLLLAFLEDGQERHLLKTDRQVPEHFEAYFTAPSTERPILRGLNFNADSCIVENCSAGNDTIQYWISDTAVAYLDTLCATLTYLDTDTLGQLVDRTDTLRLVPRLTRQRQLRLQAEELKKWEKEQEKRKKRNRPYETEPPQPCIAFRFQNSGALAPDENVHFTLSEPPVSVDTSRIHLLLKQDSVYVPAPYELTVDSANIMGYTLRAEWRPQQSYRLVIDSAAIVSIYGKPTEKANMELAIPSLDRYSSLFVNIKGLNGEDAIVELLNRSDKVVRSTRTKDARAEFYFVKPGPYYMRLFIDRNKDGVWTTGNYDLGVQPEPTYYYPGKLELRAMWDDEEDWDIHAKPVSEQKLLEITKQKPDKEKTIKNRNAERLRNSRK